jgi:hypothetical protein
MRYEAKICSLKALALLSLDNDNTDKNNEDNDVTINRGEG